MWAIKGIIMALLGKLLDREWMIKKIHDGIFKQIKRDKRKLKDDWCLVTIEYFEKVKADYKNTWENKMDDTDREVWLKMYGKDIVNLIQDLQRKEYETRFKAI